MKKTGKVVLALCLALVVAVSAFFVVSSINHNLGEELGYLTGYSMGRTDKDTKLGAKITITDKATGVTADPGTLGHVVVPYELGSAKWKGFIMAFPKGYEDGFSGVLVKE